MGDDGNDFTVGYMQNGDIPTFKIYDASEDIYYDAIPSENFGWANFGLYSIEILNGGVFGCMDEMACNYDPDVTEDDVKNHESVKNTEIINILNSGTVDPMTGLPDPLGILDIIEPILKKNGIPDDFKYLAVIESGLQNVVSPAGASGFWQIMKATGQENGLEINSNVDERYHLEKATQLACDYLKNAKDNLGTWTAAAAAYNAGNAGISRRLRDQDVTSYYDLLLGEETGRYVFRILALKEILSNPEKYGFNFEEKHLYQPISTRNVEVDTAVTDFARFAKDFGINYKILKIHNPWLREAHLNNKSRKLYEIKIPEKGVYTYQP